MFPPGAAYSQSPTQPRPRLVLELVEPFPVIAGGELPERVPVLLRNLISFACEAANEGGEFAYLLAGLLVVENAVVDYRLGSVRDVHVLIE